MGHPESKPEYRASGDSLKLQILYMAYLWMGYYVTFAWIFPILDAVVGNVAVLGELCRLFLMVSRVLYVGVVIPYIATVFLDTEGFFYRNATSFSAEAARALITEPCLLILPWTALWSIFVAFALTLSLCEWLQAKTAKVQAAMTEAAVEPTPPPVATRLHKPEELPVPKPPKKRLFSWFKLFKYRKNPSAEKKHQAKLTK
ncbi:hypothetical protein SPRG_03415 [Saprolegnia parasitica CBS 223.65]|uniref:Transmembrane protein n=1 Tax=Saprolegnia parasitica (strain CBS 223.65) TaxID=695850 RepID=A0A067CP03_SAPPC|nr:hypothetical protein SPRG_03415 [Saprolegnia parasitica CBS 223.65]KDO32198.1 hypothetical protein SPRG_03415 [Saprolegnia parasitica CBS 223.65]|eukprot:XP_012197378.1 hypothetical protein SPRG_03415 [Saprolegnia parasitica CBS 223.65]